MNITLEVGKQIRKRKISNEERILSLLNPVKRREHAQWFSMSDWLSCPLLVVLDKPNEVFVFITEDNSSLDCLHLDSGDPCLNHLNLFIQN